MQFLNKLFVWSVGEDKSVDELKELKTKISKACVYIHNSLEKASVRLYDEHRRHYYITPSFYMDLLKTFEKMLETRKTEYVVSV